ncbi:MAG TPA: hypothetical protein ENI86_07915 [Acidimicrobiales bacterium]|nr:hypothetical protein [Acidimicrobiales bacterium]
MKTSSRERSDTTELRIEGWLPLHWGTLVTLGLLMVVVGSMGLIWTPVYSLGVATAFGAFLFALGMVELVSMVFLGNWRTMGGLPHALVALAYVIGGGYALINPPAAAAGLTFAISVMLLFIGAVRLSLSLALRSAGLSWGWTMAASLVDLLLALLIIVGWPESGVWVPGLLFAVELLMNGWLLLALGWVLRKLAEGIDSTREA